LKAFRARYLYYVLPEGKAIRYGVIVGEDAQAWSSVAKIGRKEEWPIRFIRIRRTKLRSQKIVGEQFYTDAIQPSDLA
jgi:lipoprotein-anchoring transpeptidase ErfK/SrfK